MCDPVSIAIGATVAGTAVKAGSSIFGGLSAKKNAYANAAVAEQNAQYASAQAGDAIERGSEEAAVHYLRVGQLKGEQTAAMAANGIELGFGSPLEVVGSTAMLGEMDAATIRKNAKREAEGYRIQGFNYLNQAAGYRREGNAAAVSGYLNAAGSLLSGASQVAGMGK